MQQPGEYMAPLPRFWLWKSCMALFRCAPAIWPTINHVHPTALSTATGESRIQEATYLRVQGLISETNNHEIFTSR